MRPGFAVVLGLCACAAVSGCSPRRVSAPPALPPLPAAPARGGPTAREVAPASPSQAPATREEEALERLAAVYQRAQDAQTRKAYDEATVHLREALLIELPPKL